MEDQDPSACRVVQIRPGQLNLLQLAQNLESELLNGACLRGACRVRSELAVHLPPCDLHRGRQRESPVGEPQVEIEAQRASLEPLQSIHVERHGVADDLVEECLAQIDFALP